LIRRSMRLILGILLITLLIPVPRLDAAAGDDAEIRIGRDYARRLEARYKVVTEGDVSERVGRIGRLIADVSERPELPWTFKVIDFEEPNAVALPGGFVYVTKPMLSFARSDHELAAVLAHEIAHTARRHQMEMIRRSNQATFWTILIAVLTRDPRIASGVQLISYGLLSGYTRDLERDADLIGLAYLVKTPYTPVAILTLMERLAREERYRPQVDAGDLRDHPRTEERVAYLEAELRRRGIPIVRRAAANFLQVSTRTLAEDDRQIAELYVNGTLILRLPEPGRIVSIASALDRFFDRDPDPAQVGVIRIRDTYEVVGGSLTLLTLGPPDAGFFRAPLSEVSAGIQSRLRWVIEQDRRRRQFNG